MPLATPTAAVAVVRLRAEGVSWAERLPVLPEGHVVTISVSPPTFVDLSTLASRGYRLVGLGAAPLARASSCIVDLVISEDLISAHPSTWASLREAALKVFPLANGPVAMLFASLVTAHEASRRRPLPA